MYAVLDGGRLHILLRAPFAESKESGYLSCCLDFSDATEPVGTNGICACHLSVDGDDVYAVNYLSGSLTKIGGETVLHHGKGTDSVRQEAAHTHYVGLSADKRYVLCTDLGLDTLFVYDRDLNAVSHAKVPDGYGIRHLTLSGDGSLIYAVNELVPSVSRFSFTDGIVTYLDTVQLPCACFKPTAAAIRLSKDEKILYVSVRGEQTVFTLKVGNGKPEMRSAFPCGGKGPRDFDLVNGFLVVCNEDSDGVAVLDAETGERRSEVRMKHPLCCVAKSDEEE